MFTNEESPLALFKSELNRLPPLPEVQKSYLEILKVSKREVYISNLLAYFFRPNESHNLGYLFIRSLFQTACHKLKEHGEVSELCINGFTGHQKTLTANPDFVLKDITGIKVHTERQTADQKRLDIIIEAKEFVIAIEFKINHLLDNPLHIYEQYILDRYCKTEIKPLFFVVLTPWWKSHEQPLIKNDSFRQITLSSFVARVKDNLSTETRDKILRKDHDVFFIMDFIQMVENRKKNFELRQILVDNETLLASYKKIHSVQQLKNYDFNQDKQTAIAISKLSRLASEIEKKLISLKKELPGASAVKMVDCFMGFSEIKIDSLTSAIKIRLTLKGWMLELWEKSGGKSHFVKNFSDNEIDFETSATSIALKVKKELAKHRAI